MSTLTDDDDFDTPPPIADADFDPFAADDFDFGADDADDFDADTDDDFDLDGPPPLADNVVDIHSGADADDPDLTGELFGAELTDTDRQTLIEKRGISAEYLDLPHVRGRIRSITALSQVPKKRQWAFDKDFPATGIAYGWRDPSAPDQTLWQLRPDRPREADGRPAKYVFRKGVKTPVTLCSAPRAFPAEKHVVVLVEGTNQSLAVASALRDDPQYVVVGFAGCENAMRDGNLHPGIAAVIKNADSVYIAPDADAATNYRVWRSMDKLAKATRARSTKRGNVKFVRLADSEAKQGMDDLLAAVEESDRRQTVLDLLSDAMPTPCDVPPKKPRGAVNGGASGDFFDHRLRVKACVDHIIASTTLLYDTTGGRFLVFDAEEGIYTPDTVISRQKLPKMLVDNLMSMLGDDYSVQAVSNIEAPLIAALMDRGRVVDGTLGSTRGRIPFANGLVDPETGDLEPFNENVYATWKLTVSYNPEAPFEEIPKWLAANTRLDDGADQYAVLLDGLSIIMEAASGKAPTKALVMFGASRSGKGTLANEIIKAMFPPRLTTGVGLVELAENKPFTNIGLHNKVISVVGETPETFIKSTDTFKRATGGDIIWGAYKNQDEFGFVNQAAFVLAGNPAPRISDPNGAVRNRLYPVYFPRSHAGNEDLELADRLKDESEGLAYAMAQALVARRARGGKFLTPHREATERITNAMNPLAEFVRDCLVFPNTEIADGATVPDELFATPTTIYKFYEAHMRFTGRSKGILSTERFVEVLTNGQYPLREARAKSNRSRGYGVGINVDGEVVQRLMDDNSRLEALLHSVAKPTKFKKTAADDVPPPLDEPVEVVKNAD